VARMPVGPGDVDSGPGGNVNLHLDWFFANVKRQRHQALFFAEDPAGVQHGPGGIGRP